MTLVISAVYCSRPTYIFNTLVVCHSLMLGISFGDNFTRYRNTAYGMLV